MLTSNLRQVPWTNWKEWEITYLLFEECISSNIERKLHNNSDRYESLILCLDLWSSRDHVPTSVSSTVSILRIIYRIEEEMNEFGNKSIIKLASSMAIVRFVNSITEEEQKFSTAQSVANLAVTLNIPSILVDIRHSASHDKLPPLNELYNGLWSALLWLKNNYWDKQYNEIQIIRTLLKSEISKDNISLLNTNLIVKHSDFVVDSLIQVMILDNPNSDIIDPMQSRKKRKKRNIDLEEFHKYTSLLIAIEKILNKGNINLSELQNEANENELQNEANENENNNLIYNGFYQRLFDSIIRLYMKNQNVERILDRLKIWIKYFINKGFLKEKYLKYVLFNLMEENRGIIKNETENLFNLIADYLRGCSEQCANYVSKLIKLGKLKYSVSEGLEMTTNNNSLIWKENDNKSKYLHSPFGSLLNSSELFVFDRNYSITMNVFHNSSLEEQRLELDFDRKSLAEWKD